MGSEVINPATMAAISGIVIMATIVVKTQVRLPHQSTTVAIDARDRRWSSKTRGLSLRPDRMSGFYD